MLAAGAGVFLDLSLDVRRSLAKFILSIQVECVLD
jgi:hypothetical protein